MVGLSYKENERLISKEGESEKKNKKKKGRYSVTQAKALEGQPVTGEWLC